LRIRLVEVAAVWSFDGGGPFGSMFDRCEHRVRHQSGDTGHGDNSKKLLQDDFLRSPPFQKLEGPLESACAALLPIRPFLR
jgi:hypothetical protein